MAAVGEDDEEEDGKEEKQNVVVKVGMVGDAQIGERALFSRQPACVRRAWARAARKCRPIVTTA
jgi:hypothetical protein